MTPSVHTVSKHVHDWYQMNGLSPGLAWYSEQATETSHSEFNQKVWKKGYKVPDTHPEYPKNLVGALGKFNAKRAR